MNVKRLLIAGGIVLGAAIGIACDGDKPIGSHDDSPKVRLHALSKMGPTTSKNPADFTWTINGGSPQHKHFAELSQFSGSQVTIPVDSEDVTVTFTVKAKGRIDCDIIVSGSNSTTINKSGTDSCTIKFPS